MTNGNKFNIIKQLIESAEQSLIRAKALLNDDSDEMKEVSEDLIEKAKEVGTISVEDNTKIIEGIFDGQNMVGPDGKQYSVPANYASKSKLVEGDRLKLTIMVDGSFVYKQIGPVDRNRLIGSLIRDETNNDFIVVTSEKSYKVLLASITYFKGDVGDEVVILVPKDIQTQWAAVENIIKKTSESAGDAQEKEVEPVPESEDLD